MDLANLIQLINNKGITAYEISKNTTLSEVGINKILNGKTKKPNKNTIKELKSYVDKHILFGKSLAMNEPQEEYITNTNGNKFIKTDYGFNVEVDLLPFDSYASYRETLENVLIAYDFEKVTFNVDQYGHGNYMAFKINGDSMNGGRINDTKDRALVLGRELGRHLWANGFRPTEYGWIILSKDNIFHKDITFLDKNTGDITCSSRDGITKDFTINLNDVYQIFKVIKRIQ